MPTPKFLVWRSPGAAQFAVTNRTVAVSLRVLASLSTSLPIVAKLSTALPIVSKLSREVRVIG